MTIILDGSHSWRVSSVIISPFSLSPLLYFFSFGVGTYILASDLYGLTLALENWHTLQLNSWILERGYFKAFACEHKKIMASHDKRATATLQSPDKVLGSFQVLQHNSR